ncbi:MAG: hypothetical protein BWY82_02277 [Verrucomicrobia bacterium ADurb.Bin474]|nr:MAG: hypothetical protein BWY82_02277 [Verrucomicrobia bacterium ADurb.Bin474]
MVKEHLIAGFHFVPQKVARLEIPYPVPRRGFVRRGSQISERKNVGFGFEKPVFSHVESKMRGGVWLASRSRLFGRDSGGNRMDSGICVDLAGRMLSLIG